MNNSKESGMSTAVEGRVITHDGKIKILTMTYSYVSGEESWDGIESFYSVLQRNGRNRRYSAGY